MNLKIVKLVDAKMLSNIFEIWIIEDKNKRKWKI